MKKLIVRIAIIVVVLLIVAVVLSLYFLGSIVKKGVETVGPTLTKTEMKLDTATLSVLSGSGSLKGFSMGNPEGFKMPTAVKVRTTSIGVQPSSVFADKIHVTHVRVESPEIIFETEGLNIKANNLSKILDNVNAATGATTDQPAAKTPGVKTKGAARKLQVDDFLISGARLHVSSTLLGGKEVSVLLPDIHFANLGQGPEGITAAELTKKVIHEVTVVAIQAAEKALSDAAKGITDTVKNLGKGSNSLEKVTKGVGDLFNRKKQ